MVPVELNDDVLAMSIDELVAKLEFRSYTFCVNVDYTNVTALGKLAESTETYLIEALLRIMDKELNYRPFQNKLYEKIEYIFGNQDAYNINRLLSALRRMKNKALGDPDDSYQKWFKNRIKYGVIAINAKLEKLKELETA